MHVRDGNMQAEGIFGTPVAYVMKTVHFGAEVGLRKKHPCQQCAQIS